MNGHISTEPFGGFFKIYVLKDSLNPTFKQPYIYCNFSPICFDGFPFFPYIKINDTKIEADFTAIVQKPF